MFWEETFLAYLACFLDQFGNWPIHVLYALYICVYIYTIKWSTFGFHSGFGSSNMEYHKMG